MKRFFVRNLFAKLALLGLLAVPLALYGLNEGKQLAEAGISDDKTAPPASISEAELKQAQDEAAKLAAMPSDLRKELLFPSGRIGNDAAEPFLELSRVVRNRAGILAAHRQFLLQYNMTGMVDSTLKLDPILAAGLSKDLKQNYDAQLKDRRDQFAIRARLTDLSSQLEKVDAKSLPDLAKEIELAMDDCLKRWPNLKKVVDPLRDKLKMQQFAFALNATEAESIKVEAEWKRLVQLPSSEAIKSVQTRVDDLVQRLKKVIAESANEESVKALAMWSKRREFLPDMLTLLDGMDKALAESRINEFFESCKKLVADHGEIKEAKDLVRGFGIDFCTRYLVKQPKDPVKYDDAVSVLGVDNIRVEVPRRQVKLLLKNGQRRFLENGDPLKNDGYTEFHAQKDIDSIKDFAVYDADRKDPLGSNLLQLKINELKPTPKSEAVRFYCDEYRKVERWNAAAVGDFVTKCEPHKDHLGEIWNRLNAMKKAMDGAPDIFAIEPKKPA